MNTVKRAIIMAAGIGNRMLPITRNIPKPLVSVNGIRMIDSVIQGLHENSINEIYIVVGYKKELFNALLDVYTGITIIENPWYESCNNISSLYVARNFIDDVMILDGDQLILNSRVLCPEFIRSGYNAVWTEKETNEWLMQISNGVVTSCNRTGGKNGWQLYSISRWTKSDGIKLKHYLEVEFDVNRNRQLYWDDVPMFCHFNDFRLGIFPMDKDDVLEIDSYEELCSIDMSYIKFNKGDNK